MRRLADVGPAAIEEAAQAANEAGERLTRDAVFNHRAQGTGENEWYTPAEHIEAAREVLGDIDLDPASSIIANKTVRAIKFLTIEDNGLEQEWHGRVWINPPYAQPHILHFAQKIAKEYSEGRTIEAIALTHNYTDTAWFHLLGTYAAAICFTRGRIGFLSPEGQKAAPTQGQAFFYFGPDPAKFSQVFTRFGLVMRRHGV
jgi:ParB family chromosome partitioning protein